MRVRVRGEGEGEGEGEGGVGVRVGVRSSTRKPSTEDVYGGDDEEIAVSHRRRLVEGGHDLGRVLAHLLRGRIEARARG